MNNTVPERVLLLMSDSVPEDWHRHINGGGWIYKTAIVDDSVFISADAIVFGNAKIYGNAIIAGHALIYDNTIVFGDA